MYFLHIQHVFIKMPLIPVQKGKGRGPGLKQGDSWEALEMVQGEKMMVALSFSYLIGKMRWHGDRKRWFHTAGR